MPAPISPHFTGSLILKRSTSYSKLFAWFTNWCGRRKQRVSNAFGQYSNCLRHRLTHDIEHKLMSSVWMGGKQCSLSFASVILDKFIIEKFRNDQLNFDKKKMFRYCAISTAQFRVIILETDNKTIFSIQIAKHISKWAIFIAPLSVKKKKNHCAIVTTAPNYVVKINAHNHHCEYLMVWALNV